jgi:Flp pilus assembly protein TadD
MTNTTSFAASMDSPAEPATQPAAGSPAEAEAIAQVQALADAERFPEAETQATEAIKTYKSSPNLYNLLGFSLRKQNKWDKAVEAYKTALKLSPNFPLAKEYLAVAYLNMKKPQEAKKLLNDLSKTHPRLAEMIRIEGKRLNIKW